MAVKYVGTGPTYFSGCFHEAKYESLIIVILIRIIMAMFMVHRAVRVLSAAFK